MSERPEDGRTPGRPTHDVRGESDVWSIIATLVAGPVVWGGVGLGVDALLDNSRRWATALGVIVGFATSFYIVYVRHASSPDEPATSPGDPR